MPCFFQASVKSIQVNDIDKALKTAQECLEMSKLLNQADQEKYQILVTRSQGVMSAINRVGRNYAVAEKYIEEALQVDTVI